jgi:hypothetical protein
MEQVDCYRLTYIASNQPAAVGRYRCFQCTTKDLRRLGGCARLSAIQVSAEPSQSER